MKKFLLSIIFAISFLFSNVSYSQLPQCCKGKKVKFRREKKRSGALVGAKGFNEKKARKAKAKAKRKEKGKKEEELLDEDQEPIIIDPPVDDN